MHRPVTSRAVSYGEAGPRDRRCASVNGPRLPPVRTEKQRRGKKSGSRTRSSLRECKNIKCEHRDAEPLRWRLPVRGTSHLPGAPPSRCPSEAARAEPTISAAQPIDADNADLEEQAFQPLVIENRSIPEWVVKPGLAGCESLTKQRRATCFVQHRSDTAERAPRRAAGSASRENADCSSTRPSGKNALFSVAIEP